MRDKIQVEFSSPKSGVTREQAWRAFLALRSQAKKDFPQGMSLDDINEEIRKAHYGEGDAE